MWTTLWIVIGSLLSLQTLFVIWNLAHWPRPARTSTTAGTRPLVSILIPARNEESRIERCLASLVVQTYEAVEILVLDDRSTDRTSELVAHISTQHPRVRLLRGRELPPGWFGKTHACHQLSEAAEGEYLLFLDADTTHAPELVERLVATAQQRQSDLLTGFPRVVNRIRMGWWVTSLMTFVIAMHLPVRLVERSPDPKFVAANGMLMLFRRSAYAAIGGHATCGQHIVEDMEMGKAIKRAGLRTSLVDISRLIAVEMYDTPRDVWNGYTKNLYAGLGRNPFLLSFVVLYYLLLFVLPLVLAVSGALLGDGQTAGRFLLLTGLGLVVKAIVDQRFGVPLRWSMAMPLSALLLVAIGLNSARRSWSRLGYSWKGRTYQ